MARNHVQGHAEEGEEEEKEEEKEEDVVDNMAALVAPVSVQLPLLISLTILSSRRQFTPQAFGKSSYISTPESGHFDEPCIWLSRRFSGMTFGYSVYSFAFGFHVFLRGGGLCIQSTETFGRFPHVSCAFGRTSPIS